MLNIIKRWNESRKWQRRAQKLRLRKEKMSSFGRCAYGLLVNGKHGVFAVDPEDNVVSAGLLRTGNYSEEELNLAKLLIPANGNVLMVGTHVGALAIPLSKCCGHMVAVEANPNTFKFLRMNLLLNECGNVTAHNVAAAEQSGSIKFLLNRDNSGGSKRMPAKLVESYVYDNPEIAEVRAEPLDLLLEHKAFDLIFMDIEGSEYFALKGMPQILKESRSLVVEFLPHAMENVAGVNADQFISLVLPYFEWMYIPKHDCLIEKNDIGTRTRAMYENDESHDGLVFLKSPLPAWLEGKKVLSEGKSSAVTRPAADAKKQVVLRAVESSEELHLI